MHYEHWTGGVHAKVVRTFLNSSANTKNGQKIAVFWGLRHKPNFRQEFT
jgi:hypothetical protein